MPIKANILVFILLFIFPITAIAQTTQSPFQKAQTDYTFQITKYADTRDKYTTARASYLSFQTAASKNEAYLKSKDYLLQIHNLYTAYFFLVEERTNLFDWSKSSYNKDDIHKFIEEESKYVEESKKTVEATTILENIPPEATNLKTRLDTKSLPTMYFVTTTADLAQIEDALKSFVETSQKVDEFASPRIKDENKQLYQNWKSEVEAIKIQLETLIAEQKEKIKTLENRTFAPRDLEQFRSRINDAKNILTRSKDLMPEILRYL